MRPNRDRDIGRGRSGGWGRKIGRGLGAGLQGTLRRAAVTGMRGFTLIEMLIVILIIGVAMAMISVGGLPGSREGLRFETERLSHLLLLAREEAQIRGASIRLDIDESRYRFLIRRNGEWRPILDDPDLRERLWAAPTRIGIERADGKRHVEFGRSTVDSPFSLTLLRDNARLQIHANGLGAFEVQ